MGIVVELRSVAQAVSLLDQWRDKAEQMEALYALASIRAEMSELLLADALAELERLRTALESERKIRITNQLHNIAATRPSIDVAKWLPDVLKNEGLLENLKAFPVVENQTPQPSGVVNLGNPLLNDLEKKPKGTRERYEFLRNHLPELHRLRGYDPMNGNTLSSTLVPSFLAEQFVVDLGNPVGLD